MTAKAAPPLRPARPADTAAIRALTRLAYEKWIPLIGREPWPMIADYGHAVANHIIDLYEEDGALIALIELIPAADHLLIENIAVHPDHQGRGIGAKLLKHAEQRASDGGHRELRLYTNSRFTANLGYYADQGYQEFKRTTLPDGGVTVHMRKPSGRNQLENEQS